MKVKLEFLDEIDIENIEEMYNEYTIEQLDEENVKAIYNYLIEQNIDYAKDIFIERLELFIQDKNDFILKFEKLKNEIGDNYAEVIAEDTEILDKLY